MLLVHNNEDMSEGVHVYSDDKYDYCIVNGESLTRYYGPNGGDYESCPLHMLHGAWHILSKNPWMTALLLTDATTTKLYKYHDRLSKRLREEASNI